MTIGILWRVFNILIEPVSYTFISVNRRNNEIPAHMALVSLFRRFTDTNVYGTGSVKIVENSPQNIRGYTDIFAVYLQHHSSDNFLVIVALDTNCVSLHTCLLNSSTDSSLFRSGFSTAN